MLSNFCFFQNNNGSYIICINKISKHSEISFLKVQYHSYLNNTSYRYFAELHAQFFCPSCFICIYLLFLLFNLLAVVPRFFVHTSPTFLQFSKQDLFCVHFFSLNLRIYIRGRPRKRPLKFFLPREFRYSIDTGKSLVNPKGEKFSAIIREKHVLKISTFFAI